MAELRRHFIINQLDLNELNLVLAQIADRMDQLEGYRGKGEFKTIPKSTQAASVSTDLARYGDVITYADSAADTAATSAASGVLAGTVVTIRVNTLKCYDEDNGTTVIHGFGDVP